MCRSPPSYAEEPSLFALDCEMCATATDDKALLSLCLVDVNGEIVLQVRCLDQAAAPGGLCPCNRTCLSPYLVSQLVCLPSESHAVCCCSQRLVRPAEPVTDFRTAVTGRTAADLEAVDYSREDAQQDVLSLLQGVPAVIAAFRHLVWSHHWLRATCSPWVTSRQACSTHQVCRAGARAVLVGHAVHHDLRALRLDYQPVIDTSLLLAYR
jgi:RNA exonuclease 1